MTPATRRQARLRSTRSASLTAFWAMLRRDRRVVQKEIVPFIMRTIMQPFLLLFVFTYVFPKIGQGIGGSAASAAQFSTLLLAGVIGTTMIMTGVQAVAMPLVQEFGYTREIDDRVMAPLPVWGVAAEKITSGAVQALISGLVVFPLAYWLPATPVHLQVHWLLLLTLAPFGAVLSAALGLTMGTRVKPTQVPLMFAVVILPIAFLGCVYYPWQALAPIKWLQVLVLVNPLVYMSEAFRASLTTGTPHMALWAIYLAMTAFTVALTWVGIDGFRRRVLS
jgi:ABC-2 type transport system permease protein